MILARSVGAHFSHAGLNYKPWPVFSPGASIISPGASVISPGASIIGPRRVLLVPRRVLLVPGWLYWAMPGYTGPCWLYWPCLVILGPASLLVLTRPPWVHPVHCRRRPDPPVYSCSSTRASVELAIGLRTEPFTRQLSDLDL